MRRMAKDYTGFHKTRCHVHNIALAIILAVTGCAPMAPMTAGDQYQLNNLTNSAAQWGYWNSQPQQRTYACTNPWGQLMTCVQ